MIGKTELRIAVLSLIAACGTTSPDPLAPRTFELGPFALAPGQEMTDLCVAVTLHNDAPIYVNSIEMAGDVGIHHSNWFWVANGAFDSFPEGAFSCSAGDGTKPFDQQAATVFGGVLFAQSTQATHEVQAFPPGAAIQIAPHARIIANVHLLNASDNPLSVPVALTITPIAATDVTSLMAGMSMENFAIALPPQQMSRFTVECDLTQAWQDLYTSGLVASDHVDFKIYHALAHYHALGTALTFDAIRDSDGGVDTIWSTESRIGDELGGMLDPPFDMTGHSKVRLSCSYDNTTGGTITWGNGGAEMCIAFAYTDSTRVWTAGVVTEGDPGPSVTNAGIIDFTAPSCTVVSVDAQRL